MRLLLRVRVPRLPVVLVGLLVARMRVLVVLLGKGTLVPVDVVLVAREKPKELWKEVINSASSPSIEQGGYQLSIVFEAFASKTCAPEIQQGLELGRIWDRVGFGIQ